MSTVFPDPLPVVVLVPVPLPGFPDDPPGDGLSEGADVQAFPQCCVALPERRCQTITPCVPVVPCPLHPLA